MALEKACASCDGHLLNRRKDREQLILNAFCFHCIRVINTVITDACNVKAIIISKFRVMAPRYQVLGGRCSSNEMDSR